MSPERFALQDRLLGACASRTSIGSALGVGHWSHTRGLVIGQDVEERRDSLAITIENDNKKNNFAPLATFQEAGFPKEILAVCKNFQKPSPIQAQSWPIIMSGHDMVGIAATGSGKTLAFGLPALTQIKAQPPCKPGQPACLVLAPTRCVRRAVNAAVHANIVFCEIC